MNAPDVRIEAAVREGSPYPRGATWDGRGVNFALFSKNATGVDLCLFPMGEERRIPIHGAHFEAHAREEPGMPSPSAGEIEHQATGPDVLRPSLHPRRGRRIVEMAHRLASSSSQRTSSASSSDSMAAWRAAMAFGSAVRSW